MATRSSRARGRVGELRAAEREARLRLEAVQRERSRAARVVATVEGRLREYHAAVEAGEAEAEPEREAHLLAELANARAAAEESAWVGRAEGAQRVVADRQAALAEYLREHRDELIGELVERSLAARDELLAWWEQARRLSWASVRADWLALADALGISPADLPPHPLAGATPELERAFAPFASGERRDPRRLVPAPTRLLPEEDA